MDPPGKAPKFLYLPKNQWSPRFEDSFYTVRVDTFQRFDEAPSNATNNDETENGDTHMRCNIGGHGHHPAFYYKVILRRGTATHEMWRRFSQFQWLWRQVQKSPPHEEVSSTTAQQQQDEDEPLKLPPGTCWPFQSNELAAKRVQLLTTFLDDMLSRPGYANHPAVLAFLELDNSSSSSLS